MEDSAFHSLIKWKITVLLILTTSVIHLRGLTLSLPSSKNTFFQPLKEACMSDVVRIGSIIIFHQSKLWKAKFFILCDDIFLVSVQGYLKLITLRSERVKHTTDCLAWSTRKGYDHQVKYTKYNKANISRSGAREVFCVLEYCTRQGFRFCSSRRADGRKGEFAKNKFTDTRFMRDERSRSSLTRAWPTRDTHAWRTWYPYERSISNHVTTSRIKSTNWAGVTSS